jgi:hypothetical protein
MILVDVGIEAVRPGPLLLAIIPIGSSRVRGRVTRCVAYGLARIATGLGLGVRAGSGAFLLEVALVVVVAVLAPVAHASLRLSWGE